MGSRSENPHLLGGDQDIKGFVVEMWIKKSGLLAVEVLKLTSNGTQMDDTFTISIVK